MKVKFTFELKIVDKNRLALIGHHTGKKWWKLCYAIANIYVTSWPDNSVG